jgi:hypothetical protein
MNQLDIYLSRMTETNLLPAARSINDAYKSFGNLNDADAEVLTWSSNNRSPMDDMLAAWVTLDLITLNQARATSAARSVETAAFLAQYRATQPPEPSDEERSEMLAAFGPGTRIVDVVSGRTVQL